MSVVEELTEIVGKHNVITSKERSRPYREGYRSGKGDALAVVKPADLMELWHVLEVLHKNNIIILMQAANTGLTEGSIPASGYDRDIVVVNGMRIKGLQLINNNEHTKISQRTL